MLTQRLAIALLFSILPAVACGDGGAPATTASGEGGKSGGGAAGSAGASSQNGGAAGSVAKGGAAGTSAAGTSAAGNAGTAGKPGVCTKDTDCVGDLPATQPAGCAELSCVEGACVIRAKDLDGDGYRTSKCRTLADGGTPIPLGTDCDDTNAGVNPAAWDGPAGEGHPNACGDGVDQNCTGKADDDVLANGASCSCVPGDKQACAELPGGATAVFPGGAPVGACKLGSRLCTKDSLTGGGVFGQCVGVVLPTAEVCNDLDDDCDGQTDELAQDSGAGSLWAYDRDGDTYPNKDFTKVRACKRPTQTPSECTATLCGAVPAATCCPPERWVVATGTAEDCNDGEKGINPAAKDLCDGKDYNCDGSATTGCPCTYDADPAKNESKPCGSAATCNVGVQACEAGGTFGACSGGVAFTPVMFGLDRDGDGYCVRTPSDPADLVQHCPRSSKGFSLGPEWRELLTECIGGNDCSDKAGDPFSVKINPGAAEVCNGADDNCDGASDAAVFGLGAPCNNGLFGACYAGGQIACTPAGASGCQAQNAVDPGMIDTLQSMAAATDKGTSWDWNCNGLVEYEFAVTVGSGTYKCNDPALTVEQLQFSNNNEKDCKGVSAYYPCEAGGIVPVPAPCGTKIRHIQCEWEKFDDYCNCEATNETEVLIQRCK